MDQTENILPIGENGVLRCGDATSMLIMRIVYIKHSMMFQLASMFLFTGMAMTYNEDRIRGGNQAFLFIKSFDASWNALQLSFSDSMDADAPADKWIGP